MNILVTLAGHSRRFINAGYKQPKFMVKVGKRPMIEHVVDMFDDSDSFFFIVNENQVLEDPGLINYLKSLAFRVEITVIEPHEIGPVYSALQSRNIPKNEPVIISYCDFFVSWDYKGFKNSVINYPAAIPYFQGFHPASFGKTKFAYMKLNEKKELTELREKESFSDQRHNEPASAGIYYFDNFSFFEKYANLLLESDYQGLPEAYVSLISNLIIKDGGTILATPVDKFICLGTPSDVEQYNYWYDYYFSKKFLPLNSTAPYSDDVQKKSTNLIAMAGRGSRFRKANYNASKPLISILGQSMVELAANSLPKAQNWVYVCLQRDLDLHPLHKKLQTLHTNLQIVGLNQVTNGQAVSCLQAKSVVDLDSPLLIASCDYETLYRIPAWQEAINDSAVDIIVWTVKLGGNLTKDPNNFAYCKVIDGTNTVEKILEKRTISEDPGKDHLVVGNFWFKNARDFFSIAENAVEKNISVNGEIYIGNSLNESIADGKIVKVFEIDHWISFGDPWELDLYYYWMDFFDQTYENFN